MQTACFDHNHNTLPNSSLRTTFEFSSIFVVCLFVCLLINAKLCCPTTLECGIPTSNHTIKGNGLPPPRSSQNVSQLCF